jgi:hypothetical protein
MPFAPDAPYLVSYNFLLVSLHRLSLFANL